MGRAAQTVEVHFGLARLTPDRGCLALSEHQVALWDESLGRGWTDARFAAGLLLSLKQAGGQGWGYQVMSSQEGGT